MKVRLLLFSLAGLVLLAGTGIFWLLNANAEMALRWRADRGQPADQIALARHLEARGHPDALAEALKWYEEAARAHPGEEAMRGALRLSADETAKRRWIRALADAGDGEMALREAKLLASEDDPAEMRKRLQQAAEAGVSEAMWLLGQLEAESGEGEGVVARGVRWINRAAENNETEAMFWLGREHASGGRLRTNENLSSDWLNKAAAREHVEASYLIGRIFQQRGRSNHQLEYARDRLEFAYRNGVWRASAPLGSLAVRAGRLREGAILHAVAVFAGEASSAHPLIRILQRQPALFSDQEDLLFGWMLFLEESPLPSMEWPPRREGPLTELERYRGKFVADGLSDLHRTWQSTPEADPAPVMETFFAAPPTARKAYAGDADLFEKALAGDVEAAFALGGLHWHGQDDRPPHPEAAALWYRLAGEGDHIEAAWRCVEIHREDDRLIDPEVAKRMLARALAANHPPALMEAAREELEKNLPSGDGLAIRFLLRAPEHEAAAALLDEVILSGRLVDFQSTALRRRVLQLAREEHPWPLFYMGEIFWLRATTEEAEPAAQFRERAIEYWTRAAARGHLNASVKGARLLVNTRDVPDAEARALALLEMGMQHNHAEAFFVSAKIELATLLRDEKLDEASLGRIARHARRAAEMGYAEARELFQDLAEETEGERASSSLFDIYFRAEEGGDAEATYHFGRWLLTQKWWPDFEEAGVGWIEDAAYLGHEPALILLSNLYNDGKHVEPDKLRSLRWLEAAAEAGNADAQFAAGMSYIKGEIVVRNPERGTRYLSAAAEQGHLRALATLESMDRILETGVVANEQEMVSAFADHGYGSGEIYPLRLAQAHPEGLLPISDFRRNRPVLDSGGRTLAGDAGEPVFVLPGAAFHSVRLQIDELFYLGPVMQHGQVMVLSGLRPQIVAHFTPDGDARDCYAVFLVEDKMGSFHAYWQRVGTLRANRQRKVSVEVDLGIWRNRSSSFVIFSGGRELASSRRMQISHVSPREARELAEERLTYLREQTADTTPSFREPRLMRSMDPVQTANRLPETELRTRIHLNRDGVLAGLQFEKPVRPADALILARAISRMRWFPAVENGEPVPTEIEWAIPVY